MTLAVLPSILIALEAINASTGLRKALICDVKLTPIRFKNITPSSAYSRQTCNKEAQNRLIDLWFLRTCAAQLNNKKTQMRCNVNVKIINVKINLYKILFNSLNYLYRQQPDSLSLWHLEALTRLIFILAEAIMVYVNKWIMRSWGGPFHKVKWSHSLNLGEMSSFRPLAGLSPGDYLPFVSETPDCEVVGAH